MGRIGAFTTPGGHRRYRRAALERLLPPDRVDRPLLARSGLSPSRMARAYRHEARAAVQQMPWLGGLTDEQRGWFRNHGRQLAESLVTHLDADDSEVARASLQSATQESAMYGRLAAGMGLSLGQTVEGFLHFRRPFLHQLGLFASRRGLDAAATTEMTESADRAMDRMLMAAMTGHGLGRVAGVRGFDIQNEESADA
jgi:hypothetical protein